MNNIIENPLISVLLSVYNDDKNIKKSIDSILSQSYKNIELLIIDDCSTDKTYEIINEIKDSRVRIFRNKDNKGLTKSLNILIKESKGEREIPANLDFPQIKSNRSRQAVMRRKK